MKELNELWVQIATKNTLSAIDHQGKTFNTNNAKDQAQFFLAWLGIPIFSFDFWDPHPKQSSDSVFDSRDSGWKFI
jgi:hypothetical protein